MENEKIFYKDANVLITQSRIVTYGKTYAMNNISSAGIIDRNKFFLKMASAIMLVFGLVGLYFKEYGMGITALGIALVFMLISRNEYILIISSNSGDTNALTSKNRQYIQTVMDAINEAIVYRG